MKLLRRSGLKGRLLPREPFSAHTTFKIGGPARLWAEPRDLDDIKYLLDISRSRSLPMFVIGEGSNLLVTDRVLDVMAVSLGGFFQAGQSLQRFILERTQAGYEGLEFMAGIPGTIGGALRMNAGACASGPWVSDFIEGVRICDPLGAVRWIQKKDLGFDYRKSNLKDCIILEAEFRLKRSRDTEASKKRYKYF